MQITELFECPDKTVTRKSSSQRKSRRPSGKLHPAENETLGPVCLGCKASSSSVSLSMLKVPIISQDEKTRIRKLIKHSRKLDSVARNTAVNAFPLADTSRKACFFMFPSLPLHRNWIHFFICLQQIYSLIFQEFRQ